MPESFFNKVSCLRPAALLKRDFGTGVFLSIFEKCPRASFSYRTPPVAVSVSLSNFRRFSLVSILFEVNAFLLVKQSKFLFIYQEHINRKDYISWPSEQIH